MFLQSLSEVLDSPRKHGNDWDKSDCCWSRKVIEPVVNYNPDIDNSEYGEYPSAMNFHPKFKNLF